MKINLHIFFLTLILQQLFSLEIWIYYGNTEKIYPSIKYIEYKNTSEICNEKFCEPDKGYCYANHTCRCLPGYANFNNETLLPEKDINGKYCTYLQQSKWP